MANTVAFFDLDRTLIDCNSARLWIQYEMNQGRIPRLFLLKMLFWNSAYRFGYGDMDKMFSEWAATVRGVPEAEMMPRVQEWFDLNVRAHLRPGARAALAEHRAAGDRLVVATTSSQYAARLAREAFGLDEAISTVLEVEGGVLTGRLAASAAGPAKAAQVTTWAAAHDTDLAQCAFYTDSITDLALLERVGHPAVVNPDPKLAQVARRRGWPVLDWGSA